MKASKIPVLLGLGLFLSGTLLCAADGKSKWWARVKSKPDAAKAVKKKVNTAELKKQLESIHKQLEQQPVLDLADQNNVTYIYMTIAQGVFDRQNNKRDFGENSRVLQAVDFIRDNAAKNNVLERIHAHLKKFVDQLRVQVSAINDLKRSVPPLSADKALGLWTEYQWLSGDVDKVKREKFGFRSTQKSAREMFLKLMPVITDVVEKLQIEQLALQKSRDITNEIAAQVATGEQEKLRKAADVTMRLEERWLRDKKRALQAYASDSEDVKQALKKHHMEEALREILEEAHDAMAQGANQYEIESYLNFLWNKSDEMKSDWLKSDFERLQHEFTQAYGVKFHRNKKKI